MSSMRITIAALGVALAACAPARSRYWTTTDKITEATYAAVVTVDYIQTKAIVADCREWNPIIGECGGGVPAEAYFATLLGAHALIAHYLPERARTLWQGVTLGLHIRGVANNFASGYGYRFAF